MSSTYIVICYLEGIVHLLLGNNTAHVVCTATANQMALALRLNEEAVSSTLLEVLLMFERAMII